MGGRKDGQPSIAMAQGHPDTPAGMPAEATAAGAQQRAVRAEANVVSQSSEPLTEALLEQQLRELGLQAGMHVIVHCSMSSLGWVCGGVQTVVTALVNVLTPEGTIVMPAFTTWNTDPADWRRPPVPLHWQQTIRRQMPPYIPQVSPTRGVGKVAELFRTLPGVKRSSHPVTSFCAWGRHAELITAEHPLDCMMGMQSPLGRLYELGGQVLSLGVRHNSTLHLAEYIANWPGKPYKRQGCAMLVDGERQWVVFEDLDHDEGDFMQIKDAFERATSHTRIGTVGNAQCRLVGIRESVDFAVSWMQRRRGRRNGE